LENKYDEDSRKYIKIKEDIKGIEDAILTYVFLKNERKSQTGKEEFKSFVEHGFKIASCIEDKYLINERFISRNYEIIEDGDTLDIRDYKDKIYYNIFENEKPKIPDMTLYGVSFSQNYNSVTDNGLKRDYRVKSSYIPDAYKGLLGKIDNNDYSSLNFINSDDNIPGLRESYVNTLYRVKYLLKKGIDNYGFDTVVYEVDTDKGTNNIVFCFCNMGDNNKALVAISFDYDKNIDEVFTNKYGRPVRRNFSFCEDEKGSIYNSGNIYALLSKGRNFIYNADVVDSLSVYLYNTHNKIKELEKKENERRKSEI